MTQAERDGLKAMSTAIGEAFQRAEVRGPSDHVFNYMSLPRNRTTRLSLVRFFQKYDGDDYTPGAWFTSSKYFKAKSLLGFKNLVALVQVQVEDFEWESWYQPYVRRS